MLSSAWPTSLLTLSTTAVHEGPSKEARSSIVSAASR